MLSVESDKRPQDALRILHRNLNSDPEFADVVDELVNGRHATLEGAWGSAFSLVAAALTSHTSEPLVVVLSHQNAIDDFCDDLSLVFDQSVDVFPALETTAGERVLLDENLGERLRTIKSLHRSNRPSLVVTSIQCLQQPCPSRETISAHSKVIAVGNRIDFEAIARWMAEHRFQSTSAVQLPGEFCMRGGILDVFASDWTHPVEN